MCFKRVKCSCFSSRERTGWLIISIYLSLQWLLLLQNRLKIFQVSILIIMTNKRVKCCFFPPGTEDRLTNHVHRSIFTATTPVPEQTTNNPSSSHSPNAGTKLPAQQNVIKTDDVPEETTGETKLWFLLFLLALIPAVIGIVVVLRCRQRRRSRKPERKNSGSVEQKRPLMQRKPRKFLIILSVIYLLVLL